MNRSYPGSARAVQALRWLNEHATSAALLLLLLGVATILHDIARGAVGLIQSIPNYPAWITDDRVLGRIRAVEFVQANPWIPLVLALAALGSLLWLEVRRAPRWAVWTTLAVVSLPAGGYIWVCLKAAFGAFVLTGPLH